MISERPVFQAISIVRPPWVGWCLLTISIHLLFETMSNQQFIKVLQEEGHYTVYVNPSATVLFQEYFQNKLLDDKQTRQFEDFFIEKRCSGWIIKVNDGNLIPYEDEIWVGKLDFRWFHWNGTLFLAYVSPNNLFSKLEIEKEMMTGSSQKINIRIFKELEDAITWFKSIHIL